MLVACEPEIVLHDLQGSSRAPWYEPIPYGMQYIKQGSFLMGPSDDVIDEQLVTHKQISVNSFWIDETEITNNEYRQYIHWVTDSVAANLTFEAGIDYYRAKDQNNNIIEPPTVDPLKIKEIWNDDRDDVIKALDPIVYQGDEKLYNRREIDYRKIFYTYAYIDLAKAALRSNIYNYQTQQYEGVNSRQDFFVTNSVPVYPDTLVWVRDFTYSYNEPWTLMYFHHPAFIHYPVVGVTWEQANAFCHWRTEQKKLFLKMHKSAPVHEYRLPTEAEWEYAARGGRQNSKYPWGGYYSSDKQGCYMANFKAKRGNYVATSSYTSKTMKVASFTPNDYGLFDMAGNVAEWTSSAYNELGIAISHDMNPQFSYNASKGDSPALKRKVVRGGSWKDISYYLQVHVRDYEYQDSARSYIGFRCVMNAIEDERKSYE